jgi:translation initiation factor 1
MSRLFSGTPFDRPPTCPTCGKAPADCRCLHLPDKTKMANKPGGKRHAPHPPAGARLDSGLVLTPQNASPPGDQVARIRTEKRKGNRVVTVITGLDHPANDLPGLCTALKQSLGVGGSVQGRTIELQGSHSDAALAHLTSQGLKARVV